MKEQSSRMRIMNKLSAFSRSRRYRLALLGMAVVAIMLGVLAAVNWWRNESVMTSSGYAIVLATLLLGCVLWVNRADAARRRAEGRDVELAAIVDSSSDAILGKKLDGTITSWNKGAERMYGYSEEEVLGKNISMLAAPGRKEEIPRLLAELRSGHRIEQFETQRQRKDGKVIYVSLAISPIHDHNGRMVGASTVARDITAQKQAEESLAKSQAQPKGIIDSAMDAVITVDQHQRILMFNPAAEKMFGYAGGEIKGETLERLIPLRFRADHEQHVRRFGATGTTSRAMGALGALNGLRKDGREFPSEPSISQVEIEGKKLFTAIIRDVTDRVRTEESLRQSEAQIKSIIDSAMDALVTVDSQQQIVMFNPAAEKMFRCSASAALGSPLERFIPQRFRAAHAQHVRGFGETGTTSWGMGTRGILKGLRADGEEFPIEASISQTI